MIGIGTDILNISRIGAIIDDSSAADLFLRNTYTENELDVITKSSIPLCRYATHFAAKEAVFKSLGISGNTRFSWSDIEILYQKTGQPYVALHGKIEQLAKENGIKCVMISLSYDGEYAIAYAAAL